jgi:tetratricopeptide (TPR) repeat protein
MITRHLFIKLKKYKPLQTILLALLLFSLLLSPERARADAAPLQLPGGAALDPGDAATMVRMVAETVTLEIAPPTQEPFIEALVTVDFTLRNLGESPEQILVGFPLTCFDCFTLPSGDPELITDLTVTVNTLQVATRQETLTFPSAQNTLSVDWAVFEVTFPPEQDVFIRVTYTAGGWGEISNSYRTFSYVLVTGAGWYDSIGSADIIARLPYPANDQNTWLETSGLRGDGDNVPPTISGNELRWRFEDLEPTQDFRLTVVHPWQWYSALVEEENVRLNPQDGEAWGRLGRAFKQMLPYGHTIRTDPGGEALFAQAVDAYQHATALAPDDAWWHAGFAELLYSHFYWVDYVGNWDAPVGDLSILNLVVDEARQALEIDPANDLALDLIDQVMFSFPGAILATGGMVDYPLLTSTAGFSFSFMESTATPIPTSTPLPTATPGFVASDTSGPVATELTLLSPATQIPEAASAAPGLISPTVPAVSKPPTTAKDISPLWLAPLLLVLIVALGWLMRKKPA